MDKLFYYTLGKKRGGGGGGGSVETEAPSVPLDMTGDGGQIIVPSEGKLLSQVTIEKPDDLLPENILKDKNIGGIIGTLAAGGGGAKVAFGSLAYASTAQVIAHGLGVVPDIVIVDVKSLINGSSGTIRTMFGISTAARDNLFDGYVPSWYIRKDTSTNNFLCIGSGQCSDALINPSTAPNIMYNLNEETFTVPAKLDPAPSVYYWIAIAGLT